MIFRGETEARCSDCGGKFPRAKLVAVGSKKLCSCCDEDAIEIAAKRAARTPPQGRPLRAATGSAPKRRRTIKFAKLQRMLPQQVDKLPMPAEFRAQTSTGRSLRWVGFAWVDEGPATGREPLLVLP